jgi:hypothetical protein
MEQPFAWRSRAGFHLQCLLRLFDLVGNGREWSGMVERQPSRYAGSPAITLDGSAAATRVVT